MTYEDLLNKLVAAGELDPQWRPAFASVLRRQFIPAAAVVRNNGELTPIDRTRDPDGWMAAVDSDQWIATQMDDGAVPGGTPGRTVTSSSSMPSMVALMLHHTDIQDRHRVLEIGTGTGWNVALLSHRLGPHRVTSVEIDPQVAARARKVLADAGLHPLVVTGDGERGWPPNAPYDRTLATCSVYQVPHQWVRQTVPGGRIVTPWRDPFCRSGKLLALDVTGNETASGRFVDWASFMMSRLQRHPEHEVPLGDGTPRSVEIHPDRVLDGDDAETAVGAVVRSCQWWREDIDDGYEIRLDDVAGGAWAIVGPIRGDAGSVLVRQGGPRRLWDEVEAAYRWWESVGRPDLTRFGITVTRDRQWVWLDDQSQPVGRGVTRR